jgi:hypothetical protein
MISRVISVTPTSVTVLDVHDVPRTVPIQLTPIRRYLDQASKRAIIATGFLIPYGEDLATNKDVINRVLEDIRQEVLQHYDGDEK